VRVIAFKTVVVDTSPSEQISTTASHAWSDVTTAGVSRENIADAGDAVTPNPPADLASAN